MTENGYLPHDDQAERALLGAMLLDPTTVTVVEHHLGIGDLYRPDHASIYTAIIARATLGQPVDRILIAQDLARTGILKKLPGGATYLHDCVELCPDPSHAAHYARILAEHATSRRLLTLAVELNKAAGIDDPSRREHLVTSIKGQLDTALAAVHERNNGTRLRLTPASAFEIKPVRWAWQDRMPVGEITLIPGREGVGKSTFLAWMAAALTNGNLPGIYERQPAAVLYAASEDSWHYTIAPRLRVAGADMNLVYRIDAVQTDGFPTRLLLPRDCDALPDVARKAGAVALMCDPLMSLLDDRISTFRAQELRSALEPLRRAAEAAGLVVPCLVHFNKGQGGDVNTLVAGSRAFTEVARAVIAIVEDKDADEYTCVLSQVKNNLGRLDLPNEAYTIDSVTLETNHGQGHWGRVRWMGETDISAEDLLTGGAAVPVSDKTRAVIDHVDGHGGPLTAREIADALPDISYDAVRQILRRCVKRGDLVSQTRGTYESGKATKPRRNRVSQVSQPTTPLYPPVTVSQHTQQQVRGGIGVSQEDRDLVTGVTSDSCDTVTGDTRARARESVTTTTDLELTSCSICHAPFQDHAGLGHHLRCTPPPTPTVTDDEPEQEREWYP